MKESMCKIRAFSGQDLEAYKSIRLEALKNEAGMFGNSHAFESSFSEQQWMERLNSPDAVCFGLYDQQQLIGLTSIIIDKEKPREAYMTQSYIRREHQGKGLSKLLYEARLSWAKERNLKRLVVGHRKSNLISKRANQHFGFVYTHQEMKTWPDGVSEPMFYYELILE